MSQNLEAAERLVWQRLVETTETPTDESVMRALNHSRLAVGSADLQVIRQRVDERLNGYGRLQSLVRSGISDILVNGPNSVWVDSADGLQRAEVEFDSESEIRELAFRLALQAGRRLDDAQPFVDGLLPDGVRLQAAIPPIALTGAVISLRLPTVSQVPISVWLEGWEANAELAAVLEGKSTFVVSGLTGAGKTTFLRSVIQAWPTTRRVVCLEDVAELNLRMANVISLQGRQANSEDRGEVPLSALVRHSLRMRPDSLVVGEVRGPEVVEWLLAVSSGHSGSAMTVHASSPIGAINRLLLLCEIAGIARTAAVAAIRDNVDVIVHCARNPEGRRLVAIERVVELLEQ